jgi:hypothetical protein
VSALQMISRLSRLQQVVTSGLFCLGLGFAAPGRAQDGQRPTLESRPDELSRFTSSAWALIHPDRDYQGGCVVGFLAFRFSPTGYFVYNNRIRGSWRVDELGNLLLRTRDGLKFTLIVDGNTLRPTQNLPFARRFYQYQRCPA